MDCTHQDVLNLKEEVTLPLLCQPVFGAACKTGCSVSLVCRAETGKWAFRIKEDFCKAKEGRIRYHR
jgi:hypothetical protein